MTIFTAPESRTRRVLLSTTLLLCLSTGRLMAGGGPENVALVVNQDSWTSLTIANQYMELRQIPPTNVIYLPGAGISRESVSIDVFRTKILIPVLSEIARRGLGPQIDYIVYSSDFPFSIDVRGDLRGDRAASRLPKWATKQASLNGLTYLHQAVLARKWQTYLSLTSNRYARAQGHGFRANYGWSVSGEPTPFSEGPSYILSTMLAVTSGRGNSMSEVRSYLARAASADGTKPEGTVYLMRNNNIRSRTRQWAFQRTMRELALSGIDGEIVEGVLPLNMKNVMGAVVGSANFSWERSGSTILPGAICEHLTSLGGNLRATAGQTPLTEFLRHGAAGASGTVTEPYAIQAKFPTSLMHVYYGSGCSLAESFYQSVAAPYQLLIVGDPLCQPWAERPKVEVTGIEADQVLQGVVTLRASASGKYDVHHLDMFLDGRRQVLFPASISHRFDTRGLSNGPHELRIVAVADDMEETQGRVVIPFTVANNQDRKPDANVNEAKVNKSEVNKSEVNKSEVQYGDKLQLDARFRGAEKVVVLQGERVLGQIRGAKGETTLRTDNLGVGTVRLRVAAFAKGKVFAQQPLVLKILPPSLESLKMPKKHSLQRGLLVRVGGKTHVLQQLNDPLDGAPDDGAFYLETFYHVNSTGFHELRTANGVTRVRVNGKDIHTVRNTDWANCPLHLEKGEWHFLQISGELENGALPEIRFGKASVIPLAGDRFWHRKLPAR
jgi:uncharacterized protein (TIGR03790 family)